MRALPSSLFFRLSCLLWVMVGLLGHSNSIGALSGPHANEPSLAGLDLALRSRLNQLRPLTQEFEVIPLSAALRNLSFYEGRAASFDAPDAAALPAVLQDLGRLVTVAELVESSGTSDTGVLFHVEAIRETIDGFGNDVRQAALTTVPLLLTMESREIVEASVALGDEAREDALDAWLEDYGQGASLFVGVVPIFHEAAARATQALMDEAIADPVDVEPSDVMMMTPPVPGEPFMLGVGVAINRVVPELTVAVRAIEMEQGSPAFGPMTPPRQTTVGVMTMLDVVPDDPSTPVSVPVEVEVPPFEDEQRVIHEGRNDQYQPGQAVDIDGDTAVVSALGCCSDSEPISTYVSVFERFAGDIDAWEETARLELPSQFGPLLGSTRFGISLAICGDTVAVGATGHDAIPGGVVSGAVFLYQRDGAGGWTFARRIAPDTESTDGFRDLFGGAIDLDGDWLVVGAQGYQRSPGSLDGTAFVYHRNEGGPNAWGQTQMVDITELLAFYGAEDVQGFGSAVAVDDGVLVVGDPGASQAFALELQSGVWNPVQTGWFRPGDSSGSFYGASVDVAGSTIAIGAPGFDSNAGKVYLIERDSNCDNIPGLVCYEGTVELTAPVPTDDDAFGSSVALTKTPNPVEQMLAVGSPGYSQPFGGPNHAGSVYLYVRGHEPGCPPPSTTPVDRWGLLARRVSDLPSVFGNFGSGVALSSRHESTVDIDGQITDVTVAPTLLVGERNASAVIGEDCDGDGVPDQPDLDDPNPSPRDCPNPVDVRRFGAVHFLNGMDPVVAGKYQLAIEVDPHQRVIEMEGGAEAENNNYMLVPGEVEICVPSLEPDLALSGIELVPVERCDTDMDGDVDDDDGSRGYILASTDGTQISRAGINVTVDLLGGFDGQITDAQLSARLRFPSGMESPARILDPATGEHTLPTYSVPPIATGDPLSMHLDVEFGGPELESGNYFVEVIVELSSSAVDTDMSNNRRMQADQCWTVMSFDGCVVPMLPESAGGISVAEPWGKTMGNEEFNARLSFMGALEMVRNGEPMPHVDPMTPYPGQEYGAVASMDGSLGFTVFGKDAIFEDSIIGGQALSDVVKFHALAERDPLYDDEIDTIGQGYGFFEVSLVIGGYTKFSAGPVDSFTLLEAVQENKLPKGFCLFYEGQTEPVCEEPFPPGFPIGFRYEREFSKDETYPDRKKKQCCLEDGTTIMLTEPECCEQRGFIINDNNNSDDDDEEMCEEHGPVAGPCRKLPRLGRTFFPGGFPVDVDAAAKGTLGVGIAANVMDDFTFDIIPFIGAGVQVELKVPGGSKYHGGVRGTVTLCRYDHIRRSGIGMTVPPGEGIICGLQCFRITHRLTFLQGNIELFATYPWFKFCFGVPCGIKPKTWKRELVKWRPVAEVLIPGRDECGPVCALWVTGMGTCPPPPMEEEVCGEMSPCAVDPGELFSEGFFLPRAATSPTSQN